MSGQGGRYGVPGRANVGPRQPIHSIADYAPFRKESEGSCDPRARSRTRRAGGVQLLQNVKAARTISADEAAALVTSNSWIDYGVGLGQPDAFDRALAARRDQLHNVKFRSCLTMRPRAVLECDPEAGHFYWFSWHFSGYDRRMHDCNRCNYLPLNLGEVPDYYRRPYGRY